jgi:RNA polymerase sigma factor (sigma-70 family)
VTATFATDRGAYDPPVSSAPDAAAAPSLSALVERVRAGDRSAWVVLVQRLERVVWKVTRSFDVAQADREEAFQNTWLKLVQAIGSIDDPERLPGWLATTARRELLGIVGQRSRTVPVDDVPRPAVAAQPEPDERVLELELSAALRQAFARLSTSCQRILRLLTCDPPLSYAEVCEILEVDHGYIGPTRGRCLQQLRRMPELAGFSLVEGGR